MKKITFTLSIDVLDTLDNRESEYEYIKSLYSLVDSIKVNKDSGVDTFDTVMDILEYAQDLIDGDGYYSTIRKPGDKFE